MKLIVGLGNPGKKYEQTRHNVGFRVVDLLAQRWKIEMATEKFHAWFGKGSIRDDPAVLLKPTTFMNRSGSAVLDAARFYRLELDDVLVVYDDVALEPGRLRLRKQGTAGGHNGLADVLLRAGSNAVCRLRVGIGKPLGNRVTYVLSPFAEDEEALMKPAVQRAADAVECWLAEGADTAMNRFNVSSDEADDER